MAETSLYRCPGSCGKVRRGEPRRAYVCMCDALPEGSDPKFGPPSDPPKPYYYDREHPMVEFEDDGREIPDEHDLRKGVWLAAS